jgi:hypothetical protein
MAPRSGRPVVRGGPMSVQMATAMHRAGQPMAHRGTIVGMRFGSKVQKMAKRRNLLKRFGKKNPSRMMAGVGDEAELVEEEPLISSTMLLAVGAGVAAVAAYFYFQRKPSGVLPNRRRRHRR